MSKEAGVSGGSSLGVIGGAGAVAAAGAAVVGGFLYMAGVIGPQSDAAVPQTEDQTPAALAERSDTPEIDATADPSDTEDAPDATDAADAVRRTTGRSATGDGRGHARREPRRWAAVQFQNGVVPTN